MDKQFRIQNPEIVRKDVVTLQRLSVEADGGLAVLFAVGGEARTVKLGVANLSQKALGAIATLSSEVFPALVQFGAIPDGAEEPVPVKPAVVEAPAPVNGGGK